MASQSLSQVITKARDEARAILNALEQAEHPQTIESNNLYLGLVILHKQLADRGRASPLREFAAELEQLTGLCGGELEPLRPLLEKAVGIARGRQVL